MTELAHLQTNVLKDLGKMVIAGAVIMVLLALLLWGLLTSTEAAGLVSARSHDVSNDPVMNITRPIARVLAITAMLSPGTRGDNSDASP